MYVCARARVYICAYIECIKNPDANRRHTVKINWKCRMIIFYIKFYFQKFDVKFYFDYRYTQLLINQLNLLTLPYITILFINNVNNVMI
jgi:hypothetical protein